METRLQQVLPDLNSKIDSFRGLVASEFSVLKSSMDSFRVSNHTIVSRFDDMVSGVTPIYFNSTPTRRISDANTNHARSNSTTNTAQDTANSGSLSSYKLSRALTTVMEVWKEYKIGLGGHPSVEHLDQTYKATWRKGSTERKFYSRRKRLYKKIKGNPQTRILIVKMNYKMENWNLLF
jgi:hypothetical protein